MFAQETADIEPDGLMSILVPLLLLGLYCVTVISFPLN